MFLLLHILSTYISRITNHHIAKVPIVIGVHVSNTDYNFKLIYVQVYTDLT